MIDKLVQSGANINAQDDNGDTPLSLCAQRGILNQVTALLKKGADPLLANKQTVTPLHKAALNGHGIIIKKFIDIQVNLNLQDRNGDTILHIASRSGFAGIVKQLINVESVDVSIENGVGATAEALAKDDNIKDVFKSNQ